jgi:hypothetical protein
MSGLFLIVYLLGLLFAWPLLTRFLIRDVCGNARPASEDLFFGFFIGLVMAMVWPLFALWFFAMEPALRIWLGSDEAKP